ncbi:MAG: ChuX/HutX family heme-like substrate-binding protein [Pseudomonadota bacterium]
MAVHGRLSPEEIRAARAEQPKLRERDLAENLGISEAQVVAAHVGFGAQAVEAHPDRVIGTAKLLGPVMALTRNAHCVIESDGLYLEYHPGSHAAMVLGPEIDLRIFPKHWVHAFAVDKQTERGVLRSLQVFDAAGDAVHKVFLRGHSNHDAWKKHVAEIAIVGDQSFVPEGRVPTEGAKTNTEKADTLRQEWARLTDTHQFLRLVSKLKMNRLGAYRIAGAPFARPLEPASVDQMLHAVRDAEIEVMIFVGNKGCIQIHTGQIGTLKPMGPWQNVLDPGFNLHLRLDRVAEVWAVDKPTKRGKAVSVEAFDAEGMLVFQVFGVPKEGRDSRPAWQAIVANLPALDQVGVA